MQRLSRLPGLQHLSRLSTLRNWQEDADLKATGTKSLSTLTLLWLSYTSIGVIYGDIGTSPLYVYSTVFQDVPEPEDVLCAASLVVWSITLIVLVKYVCVVMLADDNGEGGTFALYATICRACGIPSINAQPLLSDADILNYNRVGPGDNNSISRETSHHGAASGTTSASTTAAANLLPVAAVPECTAATNSLQGQATAVDATEPISMALSIPFCTISPQPPAAAATSERESAKRQQPMSPAGAWLHSVLSHNVLAQRLLLGVTLLMISMVLADGVLTPAISVLSAVQGLQVRAGLTQDTVIGITCAILVVLFAVQHRGTEDIGMLFALVLLLWFLSNVMVAIYNIAMFEGAAIFRAISPHHIGVWFQRHGREGWARLAGIFLCLTGCEAMFADMGHFSRGAIKISCGTVTYPSLMIIYLGQASWLLHNPDGYSAVFYNCVPERVFWPVFVVSVAAAVVASQALISGSFSIVSQSIAMGCFPRLQIHHTSKKVGGQIYITEVNYLLLVLCLAVVAGFQSGTAIGNAYGIAVNMVMLGTVILVGIVMLVAWRLSVFWMLLFVVPFATIEGTFLSANLLNIPNGGWFSLSLAAGLSCFCMLWIWGSAQKAAALCKDHFRLSDVLTCAPPRSSLGGGVQGTTPSLATQSWQLYRRSSMSPVHRNPGMALVYSESPFQVPALYRRIVQSWGLHTLVVFVTVRQVPIPTVSAVQRLLLAPLEFRGFFRCVARYGYMDVIDQGEAFAQNILDKMAETIPNVSSPSSSITAVTTSTTPETAGALGTASSKDTAVTEDKNPTEQTDRIPATTAATAGRESPLVAPGGTVVVTLAPEPSTHPMNISKLAVDAVYVLHRSMVRAKPGSAWWRAFLLEKCYAGMWMFTSRFWQTWKLPGARLFEVGLVTEL